MIVPTGKVKSLVFLEFSIAKPMASNHSAPAAPAAGQEQGAPSSPGLDVDALLAKVPGLEGIFGPQEPATGKKAPPKKGVQTAPKAGETFPEADEATAPDKEDSPEEVTPAEEEEAAAAVPSVPEEVDSLETPSQEEPQPAEAQEEEAGFAAKFQKRVDKLTARAKGAEERAAELEAKVKELESQAGQGLAPVSPTRESPLANVDSVGELEQRAQLAFQAKTWCLENLDGGEVETGEGQTQFLDGKAVKQVLAASESMLAQHIPNRHAYLVNRAKFDTEARKAYPSLFKAGSEEAKVLAQWVKVFPEVRKFPDFVLIIGDALAGQKARFARSKALKGAGSSNGAQSGVEAPPLAPPAPSGGGRERAAQKGLSREELNQVATDRRALERFAESLIGTGSPGTGSPSSTAKK
jgi:hypothetical protein